MAGKTSRRAFIATGVAAAGSMLLCSKTKKEHSLGLAPRVQRNSAAQDRGEQTQSTRLKKITDDEAFRASRTSMMRRMTFWANAHPYSAQYLCPRSYYYASPAEKAPPQPAGQQRARAELAGNVDTIDPIEERTVDVAFELGGEQAAPPAGWARDYVLVGNGWIKDGDYNSEFSKTVLPLPSRSGPAQPPCSLKISHGPLSLVKNTRVLRSSFSLRSASSEADTALLDRERVLIGRA